MINLFLSKHVRFCKIDKETYVGWNRFFPSLLLLNKNAIGFIKSKKNKLSSFYRGMNVDPRLKENIDKLLRYKFLYKGNTDPYKEAFRSSLYNKFELAKKTIKEFYGQRKPYSALYISNNLCNLNCKYCITKYRTEPLFTTGANPRIKKELLYSVIDQYLQRNIENKVSPIPLNFNGGEMLVEWDLIKDIVQRNSKLYCGQEFIYTINTNMTLMTRQIAEFTNDYNFEVYISIDGYGDAHNRTRKYLLNDKGTFDDVIRGVKIFRKYNKRFRIIGYQGTIEYPDEFSPDAVFEMKKYGFKTCRLAPNLLNISTEDAIKKAKIMGKLLKLNMEHKFRAGDAYFTNMEKLINLDKYSFFFNCVGLSCIPNIGINLNITKMKASCMCSFINKASVPIEELEYDIYNPKLGEIAANFICDRVKSLEKNCMDCELVGICRGGCILNGLDNENKLNIAACAFQSDIWKTLIRVIHECESKKTKSPHIYAQKKSN